MFDRQRKEEAVGSDMKNTKADGKIHGMHGSSQVQGCCVTLNPRVGGCFNILIHSTKDLFFLFYG